MNCLVDWKIVKMNEVSEILVSVVVPVYNAELYIENNLRNILNQTYQSIEVIVIDDGSEDNSYKIMQEMAKKDSRLQILHQINQGAAIARNEGLKRANGKYVLFWDCDDRFEVTTIDKCVKLAERLCSDIVVYKAKTCDIRTGRTAFLNDGLDILEQNKMMSFSPICIRNEIFNYLLIQVWNKLYLKEFLLKNRINFQDIARSNDVFFTVCTLCSASKISIINEALVCYNVGDDSGLHMGNDKTPFCFYKALLKSKDYLEKSGLWPTYSASFIKLAIDVIFYNLISLKTARVREDVLTYLRKVGLQKLGLNDIEVWSRYGMGFMYIVLMHSDSHILLKSSYLINKSKTYFQQAGLKVLFSKGKMYFGI